MQFATILNENLCPLLLTLVDLQFSFMKKQKQNVITQANLQLK